MKQTIQALLSILFILAFVFGCYWLAKKLSYEWWYEDMVQETIREMVKPEYLTK